MQKLHGGEHISNSEIILKYIISIYYTAKSVEADVILYNKRRIKIIPPQTMDLLLQRQDSFGWVVRNGIVRISYFIYG